MPFCLRIRNCSGERIARHSSSDFWTDPGADEAMATTPPRNPRFCWWIEMGRVTGFAGKTLNWVLKREVGREWRERKRGEKTGLVLEKQRDRGVVLRMFWKLMMLFCTVLMCHTDSLKEGRYYFKCYELGSSLDYTTGSTPTKLIWFEWGRSHVYYRIKLAK